MISNKRKLLSIKKYIGFSKMLTVGDKILIDMPTAVFKWSICQVYVT